MRIDRSPASQPREAHNWRSYAPLSTKACIAAPWEDAEAIKQRVRHWRDRQARALDAALTELGSPEEAASIVRIEQRKRTAETQPDIPHREVAAKRDRKIARARWAKQ